MLHCNGKLTTRQVIKAVGIVQILLAIITTVMGIVITVKFRQVHHEPHTPYEHAIDYVNNPWTTNYGAGIWMGLLLLIAGGISTMSEVKPEKAKLTYALLIVQVIIVVFAIILAVYCSDALSWYETCTYTYHDGTETIAVRGCSDQDKSAGQAYYTTLLIADILVIPCAVASFAYSVIANWILFEDKCGGACLRKYVYKCKGNGTAVNIKTKNTKEFNQEMSPPATSQYETNMYV